jgi:metal-sulfur cluster biosynthetic enzyme
MTDAAAVLGALEGVRDPELDQSLVELGFVAGVEVDGETVAVRLRLPTYFCAPNFAFLMVADARTAVEALPGVALARIDLEDHFTAAEINDAVSGGGGFVDAFPDHASAELDELRSLFQRKALMARQGTLAAGLEDPATLTLGELSGPDAERCRELRAELGIDAGPDAPAFVTGDGVPVLPADFPRFLRLARLISLSLEGNAGLCRGLLKTRYDLPGDSEMDTARLTTLTVASPSACGAEAA